MKLLLTLLPFVLAAWVAAAFVAWPFWRRRPAGPDLAEVDLQARRARLRELEREWRADLIDEAPYREARSEAERDLVLQAEQTDAEPDRRPSASTGGRAIVVTALLVPVLAAAVYGVNGRLDLALGSPEPSEPQERSSEIAMIRERLPAIEQRVAERPADTEAWLMLARSYLALDRPEAAPRAAAGGIDANGDIPELLITRVRALSSLGGGRLPEEAVALLDRTLERAPAHPEALWLRGLAAVQAGEWEAGRGYWTALRQVLPDDAQALASLERALAELPGGEEADAAPDR